MSKQQLIEQLVGHAVETLPDSVSARARLLRAALLIIRKESELHAKVSLMLFHLEQHEKAQQEFQFTPTCDGKH